MKSWLKLPAYHRLILDQMTDIRDQIRNEADTLACLIPVIIGEQLTKIEARTPEPRVEFLLTEHGC